MKMNSWKAAAAVAAALSLCVAGRLDAAPALSFVEGTGCDSGNGPFSVGWMFDLEHPFLVNGLGWYDQGGDGLEQAHQVGIWGPAGDLLGSVTVPSGASAPLDGRFRVASVSPSLLPAGKGYVIGGLTAPGIAERIAGGTDPFTTLSQSTAAGVVYRSPMVRIESSDFARPDFPLGSQGFYGPVFAGVSVVPTAPLSIEISSDTPAVGGPFSLTIRLNQDITSPFDFYLLAEGPLGTLTIALDGRIRQGIARLYPDIPSYKSPFAATVWNGVIVPEAARGAWTFYAGVVEAGKVPPVSRLADVTAQTQYMIMFDKKKASAQ